MAQHDFRAGAAAASISPRPDDLRAGVWLGGFGSYRQRRATSVRDGPQCRAIALSDGTTTLVLAALDLVGASGRLLGAIRAEAAGLTGVPGAWIMLACTHSHASPDMQGLWGGTSAAYEHYVAHSAATAIGEACGAMSPATAEAATTRLGGVVRNRRDWPDTDETLTTLRMRSLDGAPVATVVNYACHPTASGAANTEVSRDWCGYVVDAVERETGGIAIYVNGAIGDVNPARDGGFEAAEALGHAVARASIESLDAAHRVGGTLAVRTVPLAVPMNLARLSQRVQDAVARAGPALSVLSRAGGLHAASLALHAAGRGDLAQIVAALGAMTERTHETRNGTTFVMTQCGYIRIGSEVEALTAPGEVLTRLALPLRASLGARHRLFLGLTHDTLGYFVPEDEWMSGRNNNYEESVSFGKRAGAALVEALVSMVHGDGPIRERAGDGRP